MPISCPHFPRCGGCQSLDVPYEQQLVIKRRRLSDVFSFADLPELPAVLPSPKTEFYRHKVQLPFGTRGRGRSARVTLGCYAADSHGVVDQHVCYVQDGELSRIAWQIREWAQEARISVYDERTGQGLLRHVLLRKGAGTGEILVGLVINGERLLGSRNLAASILKRCSRAVGGSSKIVGIVQNTNIRKTNVVLGERESCWWGRPFLFEKLGPFKFRAGLSTFFQVNPFQTPGLYDEVLKAIDRGPRVSDLYCGVGSISLWVARKSAMVTGIEENGVSVAAARKAAEINGVRNVRFVKGEVGASCDLSSLGGYDVAIVDPPRKGLCSSLIKGLIAAPLRRIVYVSCNPATLARDVQALSESWKLVSLQGVDMFPHTEHLECVAVLDRPTTILPSYG